jgi:hypothetical protein
VLVGAGLLVLQVGGVRGAPRAGRGAVVLLWAVSALLALSAVANAASSSSWERFLWAPVALLQSVLCAVVAAGSRRR